MSVLLSVDEVFHLLWAEHFSGFWCGCGQTSSYLFGFHVEADTFLKISHLQAVEPVNCDAIIT